MAKRQHAPRTDHLPAYPVQLQTAPDGHTYIRLEGGGWAWAGKKIGGRWSQVSEHFELLLARHLRDEGRTDQLAESVR